MKPHVQVLVLVLVSLKTEWLCNMLLVSSFEVFASAYTQVGTNLQLVLSGVDVELVLTFNQYSFEVFASAYTQVGTNLQLVHSGVVVELVLTFSQYWWCGRDSYVDAKCLEKLFWVDGC